MGDGVFQLDFYSLPAKIGLNGQDLPHVERISKKNVPSKDSHPLGAVWVRCLIEPALNFV